ncbi:hypothetical protein [Calorimonas adulescens]|jgi:hypothetical protein|uniref:Uncharacterized protein n=1 Tax=Calorimonas adulescens TaxID=2606906 RepID=A0A5D8QDB4_9THEO|nr:hypothetical protein [Calorimonas adulescens]TZE82129.1 hypothetical protein FWJ32_06465 [Calorimonas adulescens]
MKRWSLLISMLLIAAIVVPVFADTGTGVEKRKFINIEVREPEFYPPGKTDFTAPEDYVNAFFDALYYATSAPDGSKGLEPYEYAYGLLSDSYQSRLGYKDFVDSWKDTANVAVIKVIPAGFEKTGQFVYPRYFYETVNTEIDGDKSAFVIYNGLVTLEKFETGYKIRSLTKEPEDMVSYVNNNATWRNNPYLVALTFMGNPEEYKTSDGEKYTILEDDRATVRIAGRSIYLAKLTNGTWKILYWEDNK